MTSISKLTAALFAGSQETTLALANLNFDFSLVKFEAPIEYHGVGKSLTRQRLEAAESGSSHITARKLGALFEHMIPNTPRLFEAYGTRASAIASQPSSGTAQPKQGGIFSSFVGADGTSIWAAATSGRGAISVHLLACMLARIWTGPEATSIWSEIVQARKNELQHSDQGETFSYATTLAGNVALTRDQLAEWDNSARAWLRHADRIRSRQQTQVMLILSNLMGLSVSSMPSTYRSVIDAWVTALQGMENLVKGTSQGASSGGLLLALSSWHLYPDMIALGNTPVVQEDPLFSRGTALTLNLHGNPSKQPSGVYWSLSLSHMRYYGAPIHAEGTYATESSRISFDNLLQVVLGSICNSWGFDGSDPVAVTQLIRSVRLKRHVSKTICPAWIHMLADASDAFLSSKGDSRTLNRKLIALGRTRGSTILAETTVPPVFGLTNIESMISFLKTPGYQLRLLRAYAARSFPTADPFDVILRYRVPVAFREVPLPEHPEKAGFSIERVEVTIQKETKSPKSRKNRRPVRDQLSSRLGPTPAGVGSRRSPSRNRRSPMSLGGSNLAQQSEETDMQHSGLKGESGEDAVSDLNNSSSCDESAQYSEDQRAALQQNLDPGDQDIRDEGSAGAFEALDVDVVMGESTEAPRIETHLVDDDENVPSQDIPTKGKGIIEYATALPHKLSPPSSASALYRWMNPRQRVEGLGEEEFAERLICKKRPEYCKKLDHADEWWSVPNDIFRRSAIEEGHMVRPTRWYTFFSGNPKTAAIFVDQTELERCKRESGGPNWGRTRRPIKETCDLKDLQAALDADAIDMEEMMAAIAKVAKDSKYFDSLKALAAAYKVYNGFDGATISPNAVTKPIFGAKWAQYVKGETQSCLSSISLLDRLHTFACIAYFESDGLDMNASQFTNVMALSSGDSIYVAAWLICDPAERQPANAVCRLHGNVGKAGLILLVPPADPQTLAPGIDNWKFIDREEFDGTVTNAFIGTSLHLSFTDWCIPVDVGEAGRGRRDAEAYIIESLVSVYDRGKWIGDLDVLQALSKGCNQPDHEFFYKSFCNHASVEAFDPNQSFPAIVTIKNWDEFLEHPRSPAVAMAHDNWDAKLALAVLGVRRGDRVFVMDRICETCFTDVNLVGGPECIAKALFLL